MEKKTMLQAIKSIENTILFQEIGADNYYTFDYISSFDGQPSLYCRIGFIGSKEKIEAEGALKQLHMKGGN